MLVNELEKLRNELLKKEQVITELSLKLFEALEELDKYKNPGGNMDENIH